MSKNQRFFIATAATLLVGAGSARASLMGSIYLEGNSTAITSPADAVNLVNGGGTAQTPSATFVSNNVNGINYDSNDGGTIAAFVGADNLTISGARGGPLGSFVLVDHGTFIAPTAGNYTFSNNLDDGGGFSLTERVPSAQEPKSPSAPGTKVWDQSQRRQFRLPPARTLLTTFTTTRRVPPAVSTVPWATPAVARIAMPSRLLATPDLSRHSCPSQPALACSLWGA